jgi:CRP/FNR family transcriptional regulator, cyclic AMP receptor protein
MNWPWKKRSDTERWASIPLFEGLSNRELQEIDRLLQHKTYQSGEVIFQQDNPGVGLFIVVTGSVEVSQEEEDGTVLELATAKPGEFFGELALLDDAPRSASAVAVDETSVVALFRTDLLALSETRPRLGVKILVQLSQIVAERLRRTNRALKDVRLMADSAKEGI